MPASARPRRDNVRGLAGVVVAAVIWGSTPLFARWAASQPLVTVFWRVVFATGALLPYTLARGDLGRLRHVSRRTALGLVLIGVSAALSWAALFTAFTLTTVATAVLVNYVGPVLIAALAPAATGVPWDRRTVLPLVLALGGTAIIVGPGALQGGDSRSMLGVLLALASAATYALNVLVSKRLLARLPVGTVAFTQNAVTALVLLPTVFFLPGPAGLRGWGSVAALGVVNTGLAILLYFYGLRLARTDHVAVLSYIEPVAAVAFAALFLGESLTWYTGIGGAAVVAAGVAVARLALVPSPEALVVTPPGDIVAVEDGSGN